MTAEQIAAVDDYAESPLFNAEEKAVRRFAEELTRDLKLAAATIQQLKGTLSDAQLVVLAATVGLANWTNRFNEP